MRFERWFYILPLRLRSLFRRQRVEQDLDDEMRYHLELQIEQNIARGLSPEEARYAALRAMGGVEQHKETARDTRRVNFIADLLKDLRYAVRVLARNPGFTIVAILTIALGIGLNTTLFSVYNAVALKPLPVAEPDQVIRVKRWFENGSSGDLQYFFSYPEYVYGRDHNDVFTSMVAASWMTPVLAADSERLQVQLVSANYFAALGVGAQLGRTFLPDEDRRPGGNAVVVLSHAFWQRRFQGDPQIVGTTIRTKDTVFTVIGVAPQKFTGTYVMPQVPDFWAPVSMQAQLVPGRDWLNEPGDPEFQILARFKPSASFAGAQAQVDTLMRQFAVTYKERLKTSVVTLERPALFGNVDDVGFRAVIAGLMLVVGMVLLVACANVANMLLAHGASRHREIGIRLAIGAGRGRIVRQLLTESIILSLAGGVAGLALSMWAGDLLWLAVRKAFTGSPLASFTLELNLGPDARVFAYALSLSVLTGILFGLLPSLQATSHGLVSALKDEGALFGLRMRRSRLRGVLLTGQVMVSMIFLIVAGLLMRGLLRAKPGDMGFETRTVFLLKADFGNDKLKALVLQHRLVERLQTLPEIRSATFGTPPLFGTWTPAIVVNTERERTLGSFASDTFFDTLGIAIVRGRGFDSREASDGAPVAVISEAAARRFWPGQDPLSKHFKLDMPFENSMKDFEVIGVARDVRFANPTRLDPAHVYLATNAANPNAIVFRVQGDSQTALAAVRKTVETLDETLLPNLELINLEQVPLWFQRLMARALTLFVAGLAFLALTLAGTGIYGVMAYTVNQRVKEIGTRVALGATAGGVLRTVLLQGLRPVIAGMILGIAGALALSWILHSRAAFPGSSDFLHGVPFYDPIAFIGLSCFVAGVAVLASTVPARRALRIDPIVALRHE